jgi:hypothetical protein
VSVKTVMECDMCTNEILVPGRAYDVWVEPEDRLCVMRSVGRTRGLNVCGPACLSGAVAVWASTGKLVKKEETS